MKKLLIAAGVIGVAAAAAAVALTAPGRASKKKNIPFEGRNYAHRGLHSEDMSVPENSLEAFRQAADAGYGMELDVQLSKDGEVVVFHDDTLDRVCGVEGRVDEYDYAQLKEMSLCGTEERIPLFGEVLTLVNGRAPIIVELKNGRRNTELCEKTMALLYGYKGDVCVESFNPLIMGWFRRNAKELVRGQLAGPMGEYKEQSKPLAFALSHCLLNCVSRPHFIAYKIGKKPLSVKLCEALGALKVGYTSKLEDNETAYDALIFEFYKPRIKYK